MELNRKVVHWGVDVPGASSKEDNWKACLKKIDRKENLPKVWEFTSLIDKHESPAEVNRQGSWWKSVFYCSSGRSLCVSCKWQLLVFFPEAAMRSWSSFAWSVSLITSYFCWSHKSYNSYSVSLQLRWQSFMYLLDKRSTVILRAHSRLKTLHHRGLQGNQPGWLPKTKNRSISSRIPYLRNLSFCTLNRNSFVCHHPQGQQSEEQRSKRHHGCGGTEWRGQVFHTTALPQQSEQVRNPVLLASLQPFSSSFFR